MKRKKPRKPGFSKATGKLVREARKRNGLKPLARHSR